jgi:molybdate transport system substrate-binding protein
MNAKKRRDQRILRTFQDEFNAATGHSASFSTRLSIATRGMVPKRRTKETAMLSSSFLYTFRPRLAAGKQWFVRVAMPALLLLAAGASSYAAEVKVLATGALSGAFKEIVPQFERASGHKVAVRYAASPVVIKQIEAGDAFDVAIAVSGPMNDAAKQGFLAPGERPAVASVGLGAAVRAGAPKPDMGSPEAFKRTLVNAKSVAILPESVNGKHFLSVFERLGIGEEMKAKIKPQKEPPQVAEAVAKGEAELALLVSNLLMGVPGVDYAGLVPPEFQQTLVFTAGVGAKATEVEAASAFVRHLRSPAAVAVIKAYGMETP